MGFFPFEGEVGPLTVSGLNVEMLRKKGCQLCPLNHQAGLCSPHMKPTGTDRPDVYVLGEFPSKRDDKANNHFVGYLGNVLKTRIPATWDHRIRWNYIVRTATPKERAPSDVEIECCRSSIVEDIERTKPRLIIGIGPLVLNWMIGENGIGAWAGRSIPVMVGKHACWFVPIFHPAAIVDSRRFEPRSPKVFGSDLEFRFALDIRAALRSVDKLPDAVVHTRDDALAGVEFVTGHKQGDITRITRFLSKCEGEAVVGLDYETKRLRPYTKGAKVLTVALATRDGAFAFPFHHPGAGWSKDDLAFINQEWKRFLVKSKCRKVSHHLAFEQEWSAYTFGIEVLDNATWDDSMSQSYILDERRNMHGLDVLCRQYFGINIKDQFALDKNNLDKEKLETVLAYNGVDAKYHRALFLKQRPLLKAQGFAAVYSHHIERVTAATMTTIKGVPINHKVVERNFDDYNKQLDKIEAEIAAFPIVREFKRKTKQEFRPSNNNDVATALRELAGITLEVTKNKHRKTTPKPGEVNYSTTEEALLKVDHPLAKIVIRWRKVNKLLGTYVMPVRRANTKARDGKVHETKLYPDGMLHPTVATTRTVTWRTSSEEPNIQNWPHRGPSKIIRKQISVPDDYRIVAIDYAGIQARNVAMESKDKVLIQQYWDHYDIHSDWLERVRRVCGKDWRPVQNIGKDLPPEKLHKELRGSVKNKLVFPAFFGAVGKTLARHLGIHERHGERLYEEFFEEFPVVKQWHESLRDFYKAHGYVTGLSGFRRRAPIEINQLINAPIQADETIIVCGAWARLCRTKDDDCIPSWMIHDDLSFVWRKERVERNLEKVIPIMLEQVHEWERIVPMMIDVSIGQDWDGLEKLGTFETTRGGGWCEIVEGMGSQGFDYTVGKRGVSPTRQTEPGK
jgi:uracil-DNA glycosylase family 4